jgi:hypothetical protein
VGEQVRPQSSRLSIRWLNNTPGIQPAHIQLSQNVSTASVTIRQSRHEPRPYKQQHQDQLIRLNTAAAPRLTEKDSASIVQGRIEAQQALLEQSVTRSVRLVAATETRTKSSSVVLPDQEPKARRSKSNHGQLLLRQEELEAGGGAKQRTSQAEPNRRTATKIRKSSGALQEDSAPAAARTLAPRHCTRGRADGRRHSGKTAAGFGTETRPVSSKEKSNPGRI